jgi:hypothetical protein
MKEWPVKPMAAACPISELPEWHHQWLVDAGTGL